MTGVISNNPAETMYSLKERIKAEAEKLGFCLCGFTHTEPVKDFERFTRWLEDDPAGTMNYLRREDTLAKRADPKLLLPEAQSICVLAIPMGLQKQTADYKIASYAYYIDYHESILTMAEQLVQIIREISAVQDLKYRICIDSSPVLERSLAVRAGLGWIGKSSMLIAPHAGSALFLCEILLSIAIPPDDPYVKDGCGRCRRYIDACPNDCIDPETRTIRADRCAAYLTIEHKGEFTDEQSKLAGNHLFGCDECLLACPHNARNTGQSPLPFAAAIPGPEDAELSDSAFKEKFHNSPVLRTKTSGLRRNIAAVSNNLQHTNGNKSAN